MIQSDLSFLYNLSSYHHGLQEAPLIGVTVDRVDPRTDVEGGWYSSYPWYALGCRYSDALVLFGGVPVMLSHNLSSIETYARILDGLLVVGIGVDIDPIFYGKRSHKAIPSRPHKTQFEWGITKKMMDLDKPVLGINTGMHLINVIHGGTLFQHLLEEKSKAQSHQQYTPLTLPFHPVKIQKKSKLFKILQENEGDKVQVFPRAPRSVILETNSYHRQAIRKVGQGLVENARAFDNVVEGIESTRLRFCFGVQWNPEFLMNPLDEALFRAFVKAASVRKLGEEEPCYSEEASREAGSGKVASTISMVGGEEKSLPRVRTAKPSRGRKKVVHD